MEKAKMGRTNPDSQCTDRPHAVRGSCDWSYISLGEPHTVALLIQRRSGQDAAYQAKQETPSLTGSAGVFPINESVLCTYIDLDRLIETAGLTVDQHRLVNMCMDGHSLKDIAELSGLTLQTIDTRFRRAVVKITKRNNEQWREAHEVSSNR